MTLACAIDHTLETNVLHSYKTRFNEDAGQVVFSLTGEPGATIRLTKYMAYHTSGTAGQEEMCGRVERTLDRVIGEGFESLLAGQERYMEEFWHHSDIQRVARPLAAELSMGEIQQGIRFNLFHIIQAAGRAENSGVPAKGLTGQAYEGHYFWDTEIYVLPFLIYTSPWIAKIYCASAMACSTKPGHALAN